MANPACLRSFIRWTKSKYPAKRYMLVIWNHGQGWRFQLTPQVSIRSASSRGNLGTTEISKVPPTTPYLGGYRAVSSDDDTGSIMYNRQIQEVVESEFSNKNLDLLGYDACLMGMVETAYAFAPSVEVMVASEELEPANGWDYERWLSKLVANPAMSAEALGTIVVDAYADTYKNIYLTTLSAIRLTGFRDSIKILSDFSTTLQKAPQSEIASFLKSRRELRSYGDSSSVPLRTNVDLFSLLTKYGLNGKNAIIKTKAASANQAIQAHIVKNYASSRSVKTYGSAGLAIYFPQTKKAFELDPFHDGYKKNNKKHPVEFVNNEAWADLLYRLIKLN